MRQVPWSTRLEVFWRILEAALGSGEAAHLEAAALAFVADQLAALVQSGAAAAATADEGVQQGLKQLMLGVTTRLQVSRSAAYHHVK